MVKTTGKMAFYLIPLGIAVNFVCGEIVILLNLPLYLDTVGTIIVGALCGPLYAVIVALITGGVLCITDPSILFYMGNYLVSGLLIGLFASKGWFKSFTKSLLFSIGLGCVLGLMASCVTMAVYGGYTAAPAGVITGFISKIFTLDILTANMIAECVTDVIDKIPSVIIAFFVVKSVPARFLVKLPFGDKYIATQD